jgi:hypothetical protein
MPVSVAQEQELCMVSTPALSQLSWAIKTTNARTWRSGGTTSVNYKKEDGNVSIQDGAKGC